MRSLNSKWIDALDALEAAALARGVSDQEIAVLMAGLERLRLLLSSEDARMALGALSRLSIEDLTAVEPPDQFCGRPIIGRA